MTRRERARLAGTPQPGHTRAVASQWMPLPCPGSTCISAKSRPAAKARPRSARPPNLPATCGKLLLWAAQDLTPSWPRPPRAELVRALRHEARQPASRAFPAPPALLLHGGPVRASQPRNEGPAKRHQLRKGGPARPSSRRTDGESRSLPKSGTRLGKFCWTKPGLEPSTFCAAGAARAGTVSDVGFVYRLMLMWPGDRTRSPC
mmetsp:Transcript_66253/g.155953  ORF Transcript_66253/g.155953 Transcript_66253/m.155953 type:complete len:204 (+) Transcript_66253:388-999(+)